MADNLVLNLGAGGSTAAADDIGSVFYPRAKLSVGADGTAVDYQGIEKWSALSGATLPMPAANSLTSMANGALVISSAFDNSSNRHQRAQCLLTVRGASAFTAGTTVDVWVIESDGTTYEDGSASVTPARPPDGFFFLRAVSTAQLLYLTVDVPPALCKFLLRNSGGQAFTAVDAENTFGVRTYTQTQV